MFSGLFTFVLANNLLAIVNKFSSIEAVVDSLAGHPERAINQALVSQILSFNQPLGSISYKGRIYYAHVRTEAVLSHGRICQMHLPSPGHSRKGTELGDIIVAVDYILEDITIKKSEVVNWGASVIQTKKESYARKGISAAQLYLMTQWPKIDFRRRTWKFDVLPDVFAFYLFVIDPSSTIAEKTSIMSAPMLASYLGASKSSLLSGITGKVPFSSTNLLRRESFFVSTIPLSLTEYLLRASFLSLGSPSIKFRAMLKKEFFHHMEDVEDCQLTLPPIGKKPSLKEKPDYPDRLLKLEEDYEGDISAVRIKIILSGRG